MYWVALGGGGGGGGENDWQKMLPQVPVLKNGNHVIWQKKPWPQTDIAIDFRKD